MDISSITDLVAINELLCDIAVEQSVEGDFNIPEYQPEVFKIVKAKAEPIIVQKIASGSRATIDGYLKLTVIYQSGEDKRICSITQKLPFSRQIDLGSTIGEANTVFCKATVSFLNCRAVNQRKIDARGTVNLAVKVTSQYPYEAVARVEGDGVFQMHNEIDSEKEIASEEKQFSLEEILSVDYENCENPTLLRCDACAVSEAVEIESGRAIVGGYVNLQLAFDISTADEYRIKRVGFSLPFNQVLDLSLVDGEYTATAVINVISTTATVEDEGNAEVGVTCTIELRIYKQVNTMLLADVFSTKSELNINRREISSIVCARQINENFGVRFGFEKAESSLVDFFISADSCEMRVVDGGATVEGKATLCCLMCDVSGEINAFEQMFEYSVPSDIKPQGSQYSDISTLFTTIECIENGSMINAKCEGLIFGTVVDVLKLGTIKEIKIDQTIQKTKPDCALVVYYADEGESVWEIAKRFNTSPDEIAQSNDFELESISQSQTILIPIVV